MPDPSPPVTVKDPKAFAAVAITINLLTALVALSTHLSGALGPNGATYIAIAVPVVSAIVQALKQLSGVKE